MDDLNAKISEVLSDPESMKQLSQLASMLGSEPGLHSDAEKPSTEPPSIPGTESLAMMTRLAPMLGSIGAEDDTTRLLSAIRPFLSDDRRKKLDEASKLLRMMKLLPLLRNFNLFDI